MRRAAYRIVEKLRRHGYEAFFAGGCVRDNLLNRKPKDIDIATSAPPDTVLQIFRNSRAIGAQFGVVQVIAFGHPYEVATFRTESAYLDGRHPSSVTFSGPEQDARRRDFTINGLFCDPIDNRIIDYVDGRSDIQRSLIRTIGDPEERFSEDKLRMLRAIRLACNLSFTIVPETWEAIRGHAGEILQVSWERIRDELVKLFTCPAPGAGLNLLQSSGLLRHILPEIESMQAAQSGRTGTAPDLFTHICGVMDLLRRPSPILAFGALLHHTSEATERSPKHPKTLTSKNGIMAGNICRRLRMSNEEIGRIVDLVETHHQFFWIMELRESSLKRFLRKPHFKDHLELFRAHCESTGEDLDLYQYCKTKREQYKAQAEDAPFLNGEDLQALGYSPGPEFKRILRTIEDLQLEGALTNREEAISHVLKTFPLNHSRSH